MIDIRKFDSLGHADHGWLDARHHFSFANYYDPNRMGWGRIRVWNDDKIAAKSGFPPHPHRDMEIITYVRTGAITHQDSMGNKGRTAAGKERLRPYLGPANVDKTMGAPVTAIVAHDLGFHEHLPKLFPHNSNAKSVFEGKPALIEATAFRNGSLQGAYLIIAARALGLGVGGPPRARGAHVEVDDECDPREERPAPHAVPADTPGSHA